MCKISSHSCFVRNSWLTAWLPTERNITPMLAKDIFAFIKSNMQHIVCLKSFAYVTCQLFLRKHLSGNTAYWNLSRTHVHALVEKIYEKNIIHLKGITTCKFSFNDSFKWGCCTANTDIHKKYLFLNSFPLQRILKALCAAVNLSCT